MVEKGEAGVPRKGGVAEVDTWRWQRGEVASATEKNAAARARAEESDMGQASLIPACVTMQALAL
jgi:hypothetical protein